MMKYFIIQYFIIKYLIMKYWLILNNNQCSTSINMIIMFKEGWIWWNILSWNIDWYLISVDIKYPRIVQRKLPLSLPLPLAKTRGVVIWFIPRLSGRLLQWTFAKLLSRIVRRLRAQTFLFCGSRRNFSKIVGDTKCALSYIIISRARAATASISGQFMQWPTTRSKWRTSGVRSSLSGISLSYVLRMRALQISMLE